MTPGFSGSVDVFLYGETLLRAKRRHVLFVSSMWSRCTLIHVPSGMFCHKKSTLHEAMRQFPGSFSSRTGKALWRTEKILFELEHYQMKECYAQTSSDLGAQNDLCERKKILNLNCDKEGEKNKGSNKQSMWRFSAIVRHDTRAKWQWNFETVERKLQCFAGSSKDI